MKISKASKPPQGEKMGGLKYGKVKKSAGAALPKKKLGGLSSLKNPDFLNLIQSNAGSINLKTKKKSEKNNASAANNGMSPKTKGSNSSPGFKGEKTKTKNPLTTNIPSKVVEKPGPTFGKTKNKKPLQSDKENNSSPIKSTKEKKKVKMPLKLDDSLSTPLKNDVSSSPKGNKSPEVILGLELEKALSPKSKKEKRKLKLKQKLVSEGKVEVTKKEVANKTSDEASKLGKKKKRRRKSKKQQKPELPSLFEIVNVKNALMSLLNVSKASKSEKKELFGEDKLIYLQCNLLKGTEKSKSVLHITLPHLILPQPFEVCLITPDLKGKRNDPDEAIDFYKELLKKNNIDYISEIIPIRKLKKEYTSFEHRRNLANRFDAILADGRISKMARIGRRFAPTKKCIGTVHFDLVNLKQEFDKSLRKVAMFSQGNGLSFSIKCGRDGMTVNEIAENIMTIGKQLANDKIVIGNVTNISSIFLKTALSPSLPIYMSLHSPNEVTVPEGKKRKVEESVEDEVTTVMGGTVVVHPSGNVKVKKQKLANLDSDDELQQHKKKTLAKNNKTPVTSNKKDFKSDIDNLSDSSEEEMYSDEEGVDSEDNTVTPGKKDEETDEAESDDSGSESDDFEEISEAEGTDSEDDTDASGMEDEETDDAESESESGSDLEEKITAAEREYLQEVRQLQDGRAKKKKSFIGKVPQEKTKKEDKPSTKNNNMLAPKKSEINQQKQFKKGINKQVSTKGHEIKQVIQKKLESSSKTNKKFKNKQADQTKPKEEKEFKKPKSGDQKPGKQKMLEIKKDNQQEGNNFVNGIHGKKKGNEKVTVKGVKSVKENKLNNEINLAKPIQIQQKGKRQTQPLKAVNQELGEPALNKKHQQKKGKTEANGESKFSMKKSFIGAKKFKSK